MRFPVVAVIGLVLAGCHARPRTLPLHPPGADALTVLDRLGRAMAARDLPTLGRLFCDHCRRSCPGFVPFVISSGGGYDAAQWFPRLRSPGQPAWPGNEMVLADLARVLLSYRAVTAAAVTPRRMRVFSSRVLVRAHLALRGTDYEGLPRVDRGLVDLDLRLHPAGWRVHRFTPALVYSARRTAPGYRTSEVSDSLPRGPGGAMDVTVPGRWLWGPPSAVLDVDGDGAVDLVYGLGREVVWQRQMGDRFAPGATLLSGDGAVRVLKAGDLNGDGRTDLFVGINGGTSRIWLNRPGRFRPLARPAIRGMITAAVLADFDNDGALDLYAVRHGPPAGDPRGPGQRDLLFWGDGRGGLDQPPQQMDAGWGLAACAADLDDDGDLDLFVANELGGSRLYANLGRRRLVEARGAGLSISAPATSCAVGDVDNDNRIDLYVGGRPARHRYLFGRPGIGLPGAGLLRGDGRGGGVKSVFFEGALWINATERSGKRIRFSRQAVEPGGWVSSCGVFDHDNDGDLDLLSFHHGLRPELEYRWWWQVADAILRDRRPEPFRVAAEETTPARVLVNLSRGRAWLDSAGMTVPSAGRDGHLNGAVLDLGGDGALDLVLRGERGMRLSRWRGEPESRHAVLLRLVGAGLNRDALGARVVLEAGGRTQLREVGDGSGLPNGPPGQVHFGVGRAIRAEAVRVRWPDGAWQRFVDLPVDQAVVLTQGGHASWPGQRAAAPEPPAAAPGPRPSDRLFGVERWLELGLDGESGTTLGDRLVKDRAAVVLVLSADDHGRTARQQLCRQVAAAAARRPIVARALLVSAPADGSLACAGVPVLRLGPAGRRALGSAEALLPLTVLIDREGETRRLISGPMEQAMLEVYLDELTQ